MRPSSQKSKLQSRPFGDVGTHSHEQEQEQEQEQDATGTYPVSYDHSSMSGLCCSTAVAAPEKGHAPRALVGEVSTANRIMQMDCPTEEALIRNKLAGLSKVGRK